MLNPFTKAIKAHSGKGPSAKAQKELGKPHEDNVLTGDYTVFIQTLLTLLDQGKIDTKDTQSFIHGDVYRGLPLDLKARVDLAIPNIVTLLERIVDLHVRPEKDDSYEMKSLIDSLWLVKERIEKDADVFIF